MKGNYDRFPELIDLYNKVDAHQHQLSPGEHDCSTCGKCCHYPYFYMSLFKPEFDVIIEYLNANKIPIRVHFEPFDERILDKRNHYHNWSCPFYMKSKGGCVIYEARPYPCRVYGPYATINTFIHDCIYQNPVFYEEVEELPFWEDYIRIVKSYEYAPLGYAILESMLYRYPTVEFLMEQELPWTLSKNYSRPEPPVQPKFGERFGQSIAAKFNPVLIPEFLR